MHHSLRGDNILALSLPPAENEPNGLAMKEHLGTLNTPGKVPLVVTYQPKDQEVKNIFPKNFCILTNDPSTKGLYDWTAAGVVYVITCQPCHKLYIDKTGHRLADRQWISHWRALQPF